MIRILKTKRCKTEITKESQIKTKQQKRKEERKKEKNCVEKRKYYISKILKFEESARGRRIFVRWFPVRGGMMMMMMLIFSSWERETKTFRCQCFVCLVASFFFCSASSSLSVRLTWIIKNAPHTTDDAVAMH